MGGPVGARGGGGGGVPLSHLAPRNTRLTSYARLVLFSNIITIVIFTLLQPTVPPTVADSVRGQTRTIGRDREKKKKHYGTTYLPIQTVQTKRVLTQRTLGSPLHTKKRGGV